MSALPAVKVEGVTEEDGSLSSVRAEEAATQTTISLSVMASCSAEKGALSITTVPPSDSSILNGHYTQMGDRQSGKKTKIPTK